MNSISKPGATTDDGIWLGRARKACQSCRKRKIKCEWQDDMVCLPCKEQKSICVLSNGRRRVVQTKRSNQEVTALTKRLNEMESRLEMVTASWSKQASSKNPRSSLRSDILELVSDNMAQRSLSQLPKSMPDSSSTHFETLLSSRIPPRMDVVGDSPYSSNQATPSVTYEAQGWSNQRFNNESFKFIADSAMLDDTHFFHWKPDVFKSIFQPSVYKLTALPPKNEALSVVTEYFDGLNHAVPIYDRASFMELFEQHDSGNIRRHSSGWWASLNIVLALGNRIRSMKTGNQQYEDHLAWGYLQNAVEVLPELTLRNKDLLSVQALLGVAIFLQGTASPYPAFSLVATAIRQLHSLELHRDPLSLDGIAEHLRRVFWIGYFLDKDISLRTGQPFTQSNYDMDVSLPSANPDDKVGDIVLSNGTKTINMFRLRIDLSIIQSAIYQDLYSIQGSKRTDLEKHGLVEKLSAALQHWKAGIPREFQPDKMQSNLAPSSVLHMAILYTNFFNTVTMVHCKAPGYDLNIERLISNEVLLRPPLASEEASLSAAKSLLRLISVFPRGDYACVWLNLYFSFAAFITVVSNLYLRSRHNHCKDELELLLQMESLLQILAADGENAGVVRMFDCCSKMLTRVQLAKAQSDLQLDADVGFDTEFLQSLF